MLTIGAPNLNDPRFQQAMIAERAARPYAALPNRGAAERAWAAKDMQTRLQFAQLGLQSQIARNYDTYRNRMTDVEAGRLKLAKKQFKNEKKMFWPTMGLQGFTTLYGGYLENQNQKARAASQALANQAAQAQIDYYNRMSGYQR